MENAGERKQYFYLRVQLTFISNVQQEAARVCLEMTMEIRCGDVGVVRL